MSFLIPVTVKSFEELLSTLALSRQQLRDSCEANIARSRKSIEHSRKLIERSLVILNKAEGKKKS
jgi:hypothetical protein